MRVYKNVMIAILAIAVIMIASIAISGYEKDKAAKPGSKDDLYQEVQLFAEAVSLVRANYVDEVDSKKLIYGALKGMLSSMDDYSQFMEPDEYDEIRSETKGEFGGVGIEISYRDGILTIVTPIVGSPAEEAGVKPGDKVVKIDGVITKDISMSDAVKKLRGKPGEEVTLTVWREDGNGGEILDIKIKRAMIKINSVRKSELIEDKIGYIKLVEFQENTAKDLESALKKLEAGGMNGLILDLRNNPGGLLNGAIDVSEKFIPKDKVIVSIKSRIEDENMEFKSSGKFTHPDYPIIVMVNEGSASASEIVAGAVQDNGRGVILGEKTFGKASVQSVMPMRDGSALRLTIASYYTPSGKLIRKEGIMPDVVVSLKEPDGSEKKDESEKIFKKVVKEIEERDNQLSMAVDLMKAIKIYKKV